MDGIFGRHAGVDSGYQKTIELAGSTMCAGAGSLLSGPVLRHHRLFYTILSCLSNSHKPNVFLIRLMVRHRS